MRKTIDMAGNIHRIEWLKTEMLTALSDLFTALLAGKNAVRHRVQDCVSTLVLASYLLARRLGVSYEAVDQGVRDKVRLGLMEEPDIETRFGDLSLLHDHMRERSKASLTREGNH